MLLELVIQQRKPIHGGGRASVLPLSAVLLQHTSRGVAHVAAVQRGSMDAGKLVPVVDFRREWWFEGVV